MKPDLRMSQIIVQVNQKDVKEGELHLVAVSPKYIEYVKIDVFRFYFPHFVKEKLQLYRLLGLNLMPSVIRTFYTGRCSPSFSSDTQSFFHV